jgi:uncharacterized membrane protein
MKTINWANIYMIGCCAILLFARIHLIENFRYIFLIWNLILAYVPYFVANRIQNETGKLATAKNMISFCIWLVFFPNAPYLISDFVHLHHSSSRVIWYDAALLFMFAFTGMYLAIKSASKIHNWLIITLGKTMAFLTMITCFLLSGFGIYLGRVERWNSWNIVNAPLHLWHEITELIYTKTVWEYTIVYFIITSSIYFLFRFENRQTETICKP